MTVSLLNELLVVLSVSLAMAMLFVFEPYGFVMSRWLSFKPFNCVLCLTWYVSALVFYALDINMMYTFIASFIAEFAYRKLVNE